METGWRMANKMYEEEDIRAIAKKIKSLAPLLRDGAFTVAEMSRGIERVFEEGERKGRNEGYGAGYNSGFLRGKDEGYKGGYSEGHTAGYEDGYIVGRENSQGVELPTLTTPGTADDLVEGKQLIDGGGNIVEGAIPVRTSDNVGVVGAEVVVPEGYYAEAVSKAIETDIFYNAGYNAGYSKGETDGYTGGYTTGYNTGLTDGAENLKTTEARTVTDLKFERTAQHDLGLTVPSGYYGVDAQKIIDLEPYYDEGFDAGRSAGYSEGRNVGYSEGFADGAASVATYEDGNGVAY